jgi:hypothetical protein
MKKVLLTLITIFAINGVASAQFEVENLKADVMLGYAKPSGGTASGGFNMLIEPKYNLNDNIAVGLQFGLTFLGSGDNSGVLSISALKNYSLTGEYYLGESRVRPFAGLGAGLYQTGSFTVKDIKGNEVETAGSNLFGFAPRVGLQLGHFRIATEYHLVKDSNFLTINLGFTIGGGSR